MFRNCVPFYHLMSLLGLWQAFSCCVCPGSFQNIGNLLPFS